MKKMANKSTGNRNGRSSNRFRSGGGGGGGGGGRSAGPRRGRAPLPAPKGGVSKRRPTRGGGGAGGGGGGGVADARQKILQKKRRSVTDAREVLAGMAKTQDARNKLNRIRRGRSPGTGGGGGGSGGGNVRQIGPHILRRTDRDGKISLVTNKAKPAGDINLAIQKQLGLVSPPRGHASGKRSPLKRASARRELSYGARGRAAMDEYAYVSPLRPARTHEPTAYRWGRASLAAASAAASQLIGSLGAPQHVVAPRRRALDDRLLQADRWPSFSITRPAQDYIDLDAVIDDVEMPMAPPLRQTISLQGSTRVSNVHSRLDSSPLQPETHGILGQPKTKVVVPAGHRIVVSNLQATVSQDDIKELFEDIGQLLAARLVRPGVAEVIYRNLKDAQKAVDTYHNRQLDGQPMKCLLVNKRPLNNPTAPPITKSEAQGSQPRKPLPTPNATNKLVPDIHTIHKVLFQRK